MKKPDLEKLLAHILDCGYADIDFILDLLVSFDIDYSDIEWNGKDANEIIYEILDMAVDHADLDRDKHEVEIYTNCLDSHLYIDSEEVHSLDELVAIRDKDEEEDEDEDEDEDDKKRFKGKNRKKYL